MLKLSFQAESPDYFSPMQTEWRVGLKWKGIFLALKGQVTVICPFRAQFDGENCSPKASPPNGGFAIGLN